FLWTQPPSAVFRGEPARLTYARAVKREPRSYGNLVVALPRSLLRHGLTLYHQIRMQPPKRLGHVAIPAHWTEAAEHLWQLFGRQVLPLNCRVIRLQKSWCMVHAVKFAKSLVTEHALLPFIPLRDYVPDQAVLGVCFNLFQAILAAIFALGPA